MAAPSAPHVGTTSHENAAANPDVEIVISARHASGAENAVAAEKKAAESKSAYSAHYASLLLQESIVPIRTAQVQTRFSAAMVLLACAYVGLLLGLSQYTAFEAQPQAQIDQYYQYLMHVNIMVRRAAQDRVCQRVGGRAISLGAGPSVPSWGPGHQSGGPSVPSVRLTGWAVGWAGLQCPSRPDA